MKSMFIKLLFIACVVPAWISTAVADTTLYGKIHTMPGEIASGGAANSTGLPLASPFDDYKIKYDLKYNLEYKPQTIEVVEPAPTYKLSTGLSPVASNRTLDVPQVPGGPAVTLKLYRSVADAKNSNNPVYTASDKYNSGTVSEPTFPGMYITDASEESYIAVWYNAQGQPVDMGRFYFEEGQLDFIDGPFLGDPDSSSAYSSAASYCWPSCGEISSARARSGYIIGGLALGGLLYTLSDGGSDNGTSNGSGDSGSSNPPQDSSPPQESSPPDSGDSTSFSGTANMSCSKLSDPRNSFNFAVGSIQGMWNFAHNTSGLTLFINNAGANLSGSGSNGSFSASGGGTVAGFNTNITMNGAYQLPPNGQLTATVTTGPLSTPDDFVKMLCRGALKF